MNLTRLYEILSETTSEYRKGPEVTKEITENLEVTHVYAMPPLEEAPETDVMVDVHFMQIAVNKDKAEKVRNELNEILDTYPDPERLRGGPSYIEVGAVIGDQGAAFKLFALGEVLGMWKVITPASLGMTGAIADQMAGGGMVMISGRK